VRSNIGHKVASVLIAAAMFAFVTGSVTACAPEDQDTASYNPTEFADTQESAEESESTADKAAASEKSKESKDKKAEGHWTYKVKETKVPAKAQKAQDVVVDYAKSWVGKEHVPEVYTDLGLEPQTGDDGRYKSNCSETAQWFFYKVYGKEKALEALKLEEFSNFTDYRENMDEVPADEVEPGDFAFTGDYAHACFVVAVDEDTVDTVEGGNTYAPKARTRKIEKITGFFRPDWSVLQEVEDAKVEGKYTVSKKKVKDKYVYN